MKDEKCEIMNADIMPTQRVSDYIEASDKNESNIYTFTCRFLSEDYGVKENSRKGLINRARKFAPLYEGNFSEDMKIVYGLYDVPGVPTCYVVFSRDLCNLCGHGVLICAFDPDIDFSAKNPVQELVDRMVAEEKEYQKQYGNE